jgi:hypothetical protein
MSEDERRRTRTSITITKLMTCCMIYGLHKYIHTHIHTYTPTQGGKMGNELTKRYDMEKNHSATGGPGHLWKVYHATVKGKEEDEVCM